MRLKKGWGITHSAKLDVLYNLFSGWLTMFTCDWATLLITIGNYSPSKQYKHISLDHRIAPPASKVFAIPIKVLPQLHENLRWNAKLLSSKKKLDSLQRIPSTKKALLLNVPSDIFPILLFYRNYFNLRF